MSLALLTLTTRARAFALSHRNDRAASLVEYALLLALIAMVCVAAVSVLGNTTSDSFNSASNLL